MENNQIYQYYIATLVRKFLVVNESVDVEIPGYDGLEDLLGDLLDKVELGETRCSAIFIKHE